MIHPIYKKIQAEHGRKGGKSRSPKKLKAAVENIKKATAARKRKQRSLAARNAQSL